MFRGARQIRVAFPGAATVFVMPPSGDILLERLKNRKSESPKQLADRLHSALTNCAQFKNTSTS